jgi:hypothetical protein
VDFAAAGFNLVLNMAHASDNEHQGTMKHDRSDLSNRSKNPSPSAMRLLLSSFILLPFSLALAVNPPEFKVNPALEATAEGDSANILVIQTGNENFELRVPKKYGAQLNPGEQSIVFTSETGSSVITVKMSTNYAGALPKMEDLRDQVARKYATASLVQTSPCHTSCGTGLLFDLFQPASGGLTLRMRDGFISFAEGSFEFTLCCDVKEYDQNRLSFAWLLNSFRLQDQPARKNP